VPDRFPNNRPATRAAPATTNLEERLEPRASKTLGPFRDYTVGPGLLKHLEAHLHTLRPEARRWIFPWAYKGELPIFSSSPIRKLTYQWLEDDLRRIAWLS
jgi:hypothetical protein